MRFLFRLGDSREEGQSLYDRFEALLEELGFQIEFVPDEDGLQGVAKSLGPGANGMSVPAALETWNARRSRRDSFTSLYDAGDENTEDIEPRRPRSRASMSRLDTTERSFIGARPSTRATTRKTEKTSASASPSKPSEPQNRRNRLTADEFAKSFQTLHQNTRSALNQPDHGEQQSTLPRAHISRLPTIANPANHNVRHETRDQVSKAEVILPMGSNYTNSRHEQLYNPSRTQLIRDAETFHHYRIRSIARNLIDRWCYAALQAKDQYQHLNRLATAHDAEILLRQAFENWRVRLHLRKQALAVEKHFRHEERRVARARDLMLLSKAFTHWVQCASDERLRITNAREKVLSMKYFQAWRDITASNQYRVCQPGLRKFFGIWKKRYVRSLAESANAELTCRANATRTAYWHWFWAFCERRAPEWRVGRLRRKFFSRWVTVSKGYIRQCQFIEVQRENALRRRVLSIWFERARIVASCQREAKSFSQQKDGARALQSLRRSCIHAPRYQQVSNMVDWRVAGAIFGIIVIRYRYERQAEIIDRLRVARNAFTLWNDRLRWQTVGHRIDDRYCLEALYKWVISERRILLRRLFDERLKQRFIHKLKDQCNAQRSQRLRKFLLVEDARRRRCMQEHLDCLQTRLASYRRDERIAFEFHAPKLAQDVIRPWRRFLGLQQKADVLAKDICFYFTARRFIKSWHVAVLDSKKQKRKNAYVQTRRKQKMKLARGALEQWSRVSALVRDFDEQAGAANHDRLLRTGVSLFDHWRGRLQATSDQDYQATQHYDRRLVERYLYTWIERLEEQSRLEELAELNVDMRVKNIAFTSFNRFQLKIIEVKGREANAENLRNRYGKRHLRSIIRKWHDATARKVNPHDGAPFSPQVSRRRAPGVVNEESTSRAEDWTDLDVGDWVPALEPQSSTTPLPGYLSTPSKRAARAKAMVKISTTPLGTPFEQRLRSQVGSTPRTARRSFLARSAGVSRGSTFGAILEDSPRTP